MKVCSHSIERKAESLNVHQRVVPILKTTSIDLHDRHKGDSVLVWVGVFVYGWTDLVEVERNRFSVRYCIEILELNVLQYTCAVWDGFLLTNNNVNTSPRKWLDICLKNKIIHMVLIKHCVKTAVLWEKQFLKDNPLITSTL